MHTSSFLHTLNSEIKTCQPLSNKMEKQSDEVDIGDGTTVEVAASLSKISCDMIKPAASQHNKDTYWRHGMVDCISTIFSIFNREDKTTLDNDWEVSPDSITEMAHIGSGAYGEVFSGMFRGEVVAVKKLKEQSESNIKHLRKLNHENIVRFKGVCSHPPIYCVIMEYCQYGPLFNLLHSGTKFFPKEILKWAKDIARGMAYLHSHKIVHRDLKSPNILLGDGMVVKVSDFGTSRELSGVSTTMSFTGTVAWMAPEVIRNEPCSDKVDVWSYGVVLWELLTLEIPYKNFAVQTVLWGVGNNNLTLPVPPSLPESLKELMKQCWDCIPCNRPSFEYIAMHVEIAGEELTVIHTTHYDYTEAVWKKVVSSNSQETNSRLESGGDNSSAGGGGRYLAEPRRRRSDGQRCERDAWRRACEQRVSRTNELYMEIIIVKLVLEQRERVVSQREKALNACRCRESYRNHTKPLCSDSSSSLDGVKTPLVSFKQVLPANSIQRIRKKRYAHKEPNKSHAQNITVCQVYPSHKIGNQTCSEQITGNAQVSTCIPFCNNNIITLNTRLEKIDTIVECDGTVEVANTRHPGGALLHHYNGNVTV